MSELENIENSEEVEVIPTDNTTEELQENVEQSTSDNELAEQERLEQEQREREEQERLQREQEERERAEEARLRAIQEHEEYLNSFPETTVFYRDLLENADGSKSLGMPMNVWQADRYGCLDNHFDLSELTLIGNIYYLKGYEKPEESLDELKEKKLAEVSQIADRFEENKCPEMYFTSSLGFRVNGDRRSVQNIDNLITLNKPTRFKDYDNVFHPPFGVEPNFSVENLKILEQEIAQNGEDLYTQKFLYEYRIRNATSKEDLDFDIVFEMSDFSKN